jgi:choline dehydrogenase-like flavoprotein
LQILDLNRFSLGHQFDADLVIVGGGPAGLTIARELFLQRIQVIVVESGALHETARTSALNKVERGGTPVTDLDVQRRTDAHKSWVDFWSHADQPYGVRCRVFGGSSHAWAGKSAAFDDIDFAERSWVPYSGWPISQIELAPYLARAADQLNLGPKVSSDLLWSVIGCEPPGPHIDPQVLRSFFWQFARSRLNQFQAMRFGPEFIREQAPNVRVLVNKLGAPSGVLQ